jgi:hypothetical protein
VNTKPRSETNAPGAKFYAAIALAIITYLLTQEVLDWPQWADVALNAAGVGLAVWQGVPQRTVGNFAAIPVGVAVFAAFGGGFLIWLLVVIVVIVLILLIVALARGRY